MSSSRPDPDRLRDALMRVHDPEVGVNIVDLGLVYGLDVDERAVRLRLTMTSAACPLADVVVDDVRAQLEPLLPDDMALDVELVWDPPWTPERMSDAARLLLGWQR